MQENPRVVSHDNISLKGKQPKKLALLSGFQKKKKKKNLHSTQLTTQKSVDAYRCNTVIKHKYNHSMRISLKTCELLKKMRLKIRKLIILATKVPLDHWILTCFMGMGIK